MNKKTVILICILAAKIIIQFFLVSPVYELHRDEFLHLDQARHLAWGYTSVPPVTSWVSYLILLLGNNVFWVKFFPALFGALTIFLVWKIIEELGGGLYAQLLGSISAFFSVLLRINTLYQPNSLDILFWTTVFYFAVKYLHSKENRWLWAAAVAFAFGFLSKYNIIFLILGLIPGLLLTKERKIFRNKYLYLAMSLAFLIILPNLIWQFRNDFPVFQHLHELSHTQLDKVNRADFLKTQLFFFWGSLFVVIAALIALWKHQPFQSFRALFWTFFFTLAIFTYFKAKDYYAIGLYPVFLAFGAVYIEEILRNKQKILQLTVILLPAILSIPLFLYVFPCYSPEEYIKNPDPYKKMGLLHWEDGKDHTLPQDFADMLGWKELAAKVDTTFSQLNDPQHTLVYCDNYGQAGAINFYAKNKNIQAVSYNADYINWIKLDKPIKHVILIKEAADKDPEREKERPLFEIIELVGKVENPYAREKGTSIFILKNATTDINRIVQAEIDQRKKKRH